MAENDTTTTGTTTVTSSTPYFDPTSEITQDEYQKGFVDFYNMPTITDPVVIGDDDDDDDDDDQNVQPNVLAPVKSDEDRPTIFGAGVTLGGGSSFDFKTKDFNEVINDYVDPAKAIKDNAKKDRSFSDFGKAIADMYKTPEGAIGAGVGLMLGVGPLGGPALSAMGELNRKKQKETADSIAATGGSGGTMFELNGQLVYRKPGEKFFSGVFQGTQKQMAGLEHMSKGFLPGMMKEIVSSKPFANGAYENSGKEALVTATGVAMDAYGTILGSDGSTQNVTASQATKARNDFANKIAADMGHTSTLSSDQALDLKQALDAHMKQFKTGIFHRTSSVDDDTYNSHLREAKEFSSNFVKNILGETPAEKKQRVENEKVAAQEQEDARKRQERADAIAAQESINVNSGTRESERENKESDTQGRQPSGYGRDSSGSQRSDPKGYGGYGGRRALGGRVGYAPGGAVGASPAGFVERPPSQVPEAATVADDKPMSVQEGTFVINAAAVEFAGEEDIAKMLNDAYAKAGKQGSAAPSKEQVDVAVSRGEVLVPPAIAKIIGYDRLEKINNRGKKETSKRIEENGQQPVGAAEGGFLSRLFGFGKEEPQLTAPPSEEAEIPKQGFAEKPMAEASTPLPPYTDFENTARDLLLLLEGNVSEGYVPKGRSNSGVTVGIGFDVGQHNPTDLEKMGLNTNLIAKLTPYLKKKGQAARDVLETVPLKLTEPEMEEVNRLALRSKYEKFEKNYPKYAKIPDAGKRAVMFSASYLGALKRYETFRKEFDKGQNLKRAIKVGLFGKIKNQGDPEYNRAEKALDWYSEYERENMQLPTPKPNSSATR